LSYSKWRSWRTIDYWTFICSSFNGVYIYFESVFLQFVQRLKSPNFMPQIRSFVMNGKLDGAQQLCIQENVPVAQDWYLRGFLELEDL